MQIEPTALPGALLLSAPQHRDDRGFFQRTFDAAIGSEHGIELGPRCQDSLSRSQTGVLRGMHGRFGRGEAKLVRCVGGAVLDVIVDARADSPTFGEHLAVELSADNGRGLWIPRGFLHGFQVLDGPAFVAYRIDAPHDPTEDASVRYDDPDLALPWRGEPRLVSERDLAAGSWADLAGRLRAGTH